MNWVLVFLAAAWVAGAVLAFRAGPVTEPPSPAPPEPPPASGPEPFTDRERRALTEIAAASAGRETPERLHGARCFADDFRQAHPGITDAELGRIMLRVSAWTSAMGRGARCDCLQQTAWILALTAEDLTRLERTATPGDTL